MIHVTTKPRDGLKGELKCWSCFFKRLFQSRKGKNAWANTAEFFEERILEQFARSRDPSGNVWKRLAPATLNARLVRKNRTRKPLIDTGKMFRSLEVKKTLTTIAFEMDWPASIHQKGTQRIPKRRIFPIGNEIKQWEKDAAQYYKQELKEV
jgi:hypothetical protein